MKKKTTINLILSAFLIIAFVGCTYFFSTLNQSDSVQSMINAIVTAVFGLILFYATRVGDGKPVKRFSLATLIILDLPALYLLLTSTAPSLPLGDTFGSNSLVVALAGVALGYGIPYTFLSGFEITEEEVAEGFVENGIMEEIEDTEELEEMEEMEDTISNAIANDDADDSADDASVEINI